MDPSRQKYIDLLILTKLDDEDLDNICLIDPYFQELCNSKEFWILKIQKEFGDRAYQADRSAARQYYNLKDKHEFVKFLYQVYNGEHDGKIIFEFEEGGDEKSVIDLEIKSLERIDNIFRIDIGMHYNSGDDVYTTGLGGIIEVNLDTFDLNGQLEGYEMERAERDLISNYDAEEFYANWLMLIFN